MLSFIRKLFSSPTDAEAYANGAAFVEQEFVNTPKHVWLERAAELRGLASGGFNTKSHHYAYDRGINHALNKLGVE